MTYAPLERRLIIFFRLAMGWTFSLRSLAPSLRSRVKCMTSPLDWSILYRRHAEAVAKVSLGVFNVPAQGPRHLRLHSY